MLFNSFHFVFKFFPLVTLAFFLTPHRFRWALLLAASTYFYVVFVPKYILILGALILVDYVSAILIAREEGPWRRRWLILSLLSNIGILGLFKYFNFFNENVAAVARLLGWKYGIKNLSWFLPLGLSFHTFQSMAYTIEVYRRRQEPERHLGIYALYVMFYPQVVAGPIERPQHMLPQFHEEKKFDFDRVVSGLQLMVWGLFKKAFVADTLAIIVDQVYLKPGAHEGWALPYAISTYAFCFQVYCDFSGYSDVARGAGRVMGYEMVENFRYPFIAQSVAEFWQRWHVSLSTWFRDYMYLPLVYSTRDDKGAIRVNMTYLYILLVFMTSGFWHGAAWHYGLWGLSHGALIAAGSLLKPWRARAQKRLKLDRYRTAHGLYKVFVTFHVIWFTFILVRADSVPDAVTIMRNLIVAPLNLRRGWSAYCLDNVFQLGALGVAIVLVVEKLQRTDAWEKLERMKFGFSFRQVFYAALVVLILIAAPMLDRAFIYFQF